jgi:hypothetical protein
MIDWSDPAARLALIERIGPEAYNAALAEHQRASTVATVKGRGIRPIASRWGRLFMIEGTGLAFDTLAEAEEYAGNLPPMEESDG